MAAEAQHATRSREQGSFAQRPPRMPVPADSLAATFTLSRRRGVSWIEPAFEDISDAAEELLDRLYRIKSGLRTVSADAFEQMEGAESKLAQGLAEDRYLAIESLRDQLDAVHLLANAINERVGGTAVAA